MTKIKDFATNHPLSTTLLTVVVYFLLGGIYAGLVMVVTGTGLFDPLPQSIGSLLAIFTLLSIAWQFGWLRPMGITSLGSWRAWLAGLVLLVYILILYLLVFFGELDLNLRYLVNSDAARTIFWRQLVVGFVEESLFRGIILYTLVRVWGGSKRGLFASMLLSAGLFGLPHLLQGLSGQEMNLALFVIVEAIISGLWYAAYVLLSGTLWPIILIHAISNMVVGMKALSEPGWNLTVSGLVGVVLLQLPLLFFGFWLLNRQDPRPVAPDIP